MLQLFRKSSSSIPHAQMHGVTWRKAILALILAVVVGLSGLLELLKFPNLVAYDWLVRKSYPVSQPNHLLMLEVETALLIEDPSFIVSLTDRLRELNPELILILNDLGAVNARIDANISNQPGVFYIPTLRRTLLDGNRIGYSVGNFTGDADMGFSLPPVAQQGIARGLYPAIETDLGRLTAFQSNLARDDISGTVIEDKPFFVNFNNGSPVIPRIKSERLIQQGIISSLVDGKIVLIVPPLNTTVLGLATPVSADQGVVTFHHFQAQALNTSINGSAISLLKPLTGSFLSMLVFIMSISLFQWQRAMGGAVTVIFLSVLVVLIGWLLVSFAYLFIPVVDILGSLLIAFFLTHQLTRVSEEKIISELGRDLSTRLRLRRMAHNFFSSTDPWMQLNVFLNQYLQLERSLLLKQNIDSVTVQETHSTGCSFDDIEESRRDYTKTPYLEALQQEPPIELIERAFFKIEREDERQFLTVLRFGEEVMGFWALSIVADKDWDAEKFTHNITAFARQLGTLLYQRQQYLENIKTQRSVLGRLLKLDIGLLSHTRFKSIVIDMENRLQIMEDIFDGMSTAAILYDLFGQVISSNQLLERLAKDIELPLYEMTAHDLLVKVIELSPEEARIRLRHVIMSASSVDFPLTDLADESQYLVHVRPVKWQPKTDGLDSNDKARPFQLLGVMFEFINVTPIKRKFSLDVPFYDHIFSELRNDLSVLSMVQLQLGMSQQDGSNKLLDTMGETLERSTRVVDRTEQMLRENVVAQSRGGKPLYPTSVVDHAIRNVEEAAAQSRVTIVTNMLNFSSLVFAGQEELESLFVSAFLFIIEDSLPNSEVNVDLTEHITESGREILITLVNEGYGMPQQELNAAMDNNSNVAIGDPIIELKKDLQSVYIWKLSMDIKTETGKGYVIQFKIPCIGFYE